ncbi:MAG: hypothetical protein KF847_06600 [Pirellulales bacterium]|nr:hypothetical protein [Pirellulales bacterium]
MPLLKRLEARFGRYAVPNLTLALISGQALLYVLTSLPQGAHVENVMLVPAKVVDGEIWRLATFLFMPPAIGPLFVLFHFLLFNLYGTAVEHHLGRFRYNLYFAIGYLANVLAAFAGAAILGGFGPDGKFELAPIAASNYFLYGTVFLGFARLFPEYTIYLFFVLPVKIRWLAWLAWAMMAYAVYIGGWLAALLVGASVLNYFLFFGLDHVREARAAHRRIAFEAKARSALKPPRHECRVCGLDSDESPRTLFRYCSKCAGQVCYCPEHIRDHEHVAEEAKATR